MKKILVFLIIFQFLGCAELQQVVNQLPQGGALGNEEIAGGLREALNMGIDKQVSKLTLEDGFYKNELVKILLPEELQKVDNTLRKIGLSNLADEGLKVLNQASRNDLKVVPATFGNDSRTFEVYPQTSGWEYKVLEDCPSVNKDDCVAACFVEYPAQSRSVGFTTLTADASTNSSPVPEQTATYKKRVIKTPARMDEIDVPAEYATIKKRVLDTPASTTTNTIAAQYQTVTRTVLDKKGGITTWEEVDCEVLNATPIPVYYETGSARLTSASKKVIDERLLTILNDKPVNIEIMSHTDSRGNDDFNQSLSQQRANSVVNYLVSKGISRSRLSAKGYGETRLANRCANGVDCSENQHQQNRRTEFRVLSN